MTTQPQRELEPEPRTKSFARRVAAASAVLLALGAPFFGAALAEPGEILGKPSLLVVPIDGMAPGAMAALNGPIECTDTGHETHRHELLYGLGSDTAECGPPGTECFVEGELYRCVVECWAWRMPATSPACEADFGRDVVYASVGVYYCPPKGINLACDANSEPTDSQVYSIGFKSYVSRDEPGGYCLEGDERGYVFAPFFDHGVLENLNGPSEICPRARGVVVYYTGSTTGALGAYFDFYAQRP